MGYYRIPISVPDSSLTCRCYVIDNQFRYTTGGNTTLLRQIGNIDVQHRITTDAFLWQYDIVVRCRYTTPVIPTILRLLYNRII